MSRNQKSHQDIYGQQYEQTVHICRAQAVRIHKKKKKHSVILHVFLENEIRSHSHGRFPILRRI